MPFSILTVQEASTLKLLYDSLDDVMAQGDLAQMLSALGTMRSSLDSLVNVPEFSGITDKVAMLETRVKEMAVPKLAKAITEREGMRLPTSSTTVTRSCEAHSVNLKL